MAKNLSGGKFTKSPGYQALLARQKGREKQRKEKSEKKKGKRN